MRFVLIRTRRAHISAHTHTRTQAHEIIFIFCCGVWHHDIYFGVFVFSRIVHKYSLTHTKQLYTFRSETTNLFHPFERAHHHRPRTLHVSFRSLSTTPSLSLFFPSLSPTHPHLAVSLFVPACFYCCYFHNRSQTSIHDISSTNPHAIYWLSAFSSCVILYPRPSFKFGPSESRFPRCLSLIAGCNLCSIFAPV